NELIEKITKRIPKCLNKEELIHVTVPSLIYSMDMEDAERELLIIKMRQAWDNELIEKITKRIPKCLNKEELIHVTVPSLIYSMDMEDAERELLIIKMRQAWGQVKYRNKIKKENKVNFNFVTDKRTKEKLKKISHVYDLTMNETLDRLINAAYQSSSKKHES
ncbi:hypothetical protein L1D10_21055, partial [Vibrio kanaloae]|nr:hypothetical protein [Vibrio kanaloae]